MTVINLHELLYGLKKLSKQVKQILQLLALSYTKNDANLSSQIELDMEKSGAAIRRTDAMIASVCINNSARLYTFDRRRFEPLQTFGLKLFV